MKESKRVLIVGAGPVGMVVALGLSKKGIPVTVFDYEAGPVRDQRAASLHPSTLELLEPLGVTDLIIPRGLISTNYQYRDRVSGDLIAEFDLGTMSDELEFPFVLQYEQYKLTRDIAATYATSADFDVRYGHKVTGITTTEDGVSVTVETAEGVETHQGSYVVGADGGRSTVRKISGISFEGFTYPERFVKIATTFDFGEAHPEYSYRNYFSDPVEWCNLFKVKGEDDKGLWRAIFPTNVDESDNDVLSTEGIETRMQKFFPKKGHYDIVYANVYGVNQRVAKTFNKGRLVLAGDAAHVNNPIGGMGMNGGIHDAINLVDKLSRVLVNSDNDELLDLYSRQRRHAAVKYVQAQTIANKKMLEEKDEASRQKRFDELRRIASSPDTAKAYMRRASLIESLATANEIT